MARIRTIKPEFWTDERVGECSVSARLLLIAALNFADDYGGLERSSKQLKAQVFPYVSIDCEPLVLELLRVGLFIEYQVADRKYLHIKGFRKHQKVEKPAKPRIPLYEESASSHPPLPEVSPSPPRGVAVSSLEWIKEGNGSRKGSLQNPEEIFRTLLKTSGKEPPRTEKIQKAIDKIGGWPKIRNCTEYELPQAQRAFCEAYQ